MRVGIIGTDNSLADHSLVVRTLLAHNSARTLAAHTCHSLAVVHTLVADHNPVGCILVAHNPAVHSLAVHNIVARNLVGHRVAEHNQTADHIAAAECRLVAEYIPLAHILADHRTDYNPLGHIADCMFVQADSAYTSAH